MSNHSKELLELRTPTRDAAEASVLEALRGLQFGVVTAIVQDGVIVQIERTERTRFRTKPTLNR